MMEVRRPCDLCDEHKSQLSALIGLEASVIKHFEHLPQAQQFKLTMLWFEQDLITRREEMVQGRLDKRTAQIQGYKKTNIGNIRR